VRQQRQGAISNTRVTRQLYVGGMQ
jgi:hypothetical protein